MTPWTAARQASLSITNSRSLLKFMFIELVMPSNHLILCRPLLLPPSIFPSIRVFSNESILHIRWPQYWSFSFSISPNEYSGLVSFPGQCVWSFLLPPKKSRPCSYTYCEYKCPIPACGAHPSSPRRRPYPISKSHCPPVSCSRSHVHWTQDVMGHLASQHMCVPVGACV